MFTGKCPFLLRRHKLFPHHLCQMLTTILMLPCFVVVLAVLAQRACAVEHADSTSMTRENLRAQIDNLEEFLKIKVGTVRPSQLQNHWLQLAMLYQVRNCMGYISIVMFTALSTSCDAVCRFLMLGFTTGGLIRHQLWKHLTQRWRLTWMMPPSHTPCIGRACCFA